MMMPKVWWAKPKINKIGEDVIFTIYKKLPVWLRRCISYVYARKFVVGVVMLVEHEKRYLLVKNHYQNFWTLPAGFLERGESPEACLNRELKEELDLTVQDIHFLKAVSHPQRASLDLLMKCTASTKTLKPDGKEVEQAQFFALQELPPNILVSHLEYLHS